MPKLGAVPNMSFAQRKFKELDVDKNGSLDVDEAIELAQWVYTTHHPSGIPLSKKRAADEARKLVRSLDKNGDDEISFDEFETFFEEAAASERWSAAYAKFIELDDDNSGELSVEELKDLAEWVYNTFSDHDHLTPDQVTQHIYANLFLILCKLTLRCVLTGYRRGSKTLSQA